MGAIDANLARILAENLRVGRSMQYYAELEKKIQAATPKQVDEAFRKRVDPARMIIVEAGDFKRQPNSEKSAP